MEPSNRSISTGDRNGEQQEMEQKFRERVCLPVLEFIMKMLMFFDGLKKVAGIMCKDRRRASVIVDAAVCLPVFLLAMGLILCLMMEIRAEENEFCILTDKAVKDMQVKGAVYRLSHGSVSVQGVREKRASVSVRLPYIADKGKTKAVEYLVYRPFIGADGDPDRGDTRVYVFPKRGQRYHTRECFILQEGAVEVILSKDLRKKYKACTICHPEELKNGSHVFMFGSNSSMFHRKSCASISKAFISMTLSQAESDGYTPCMHCFGGGGYFDVSEPEDPSGE